MWRNDVDGTSAWSFFWLVATTGTVQRKIRLIKWYILYVSIFFFLPSYLSSTFAVLLKRVLFWWLHVWRWKIELDTSQKVSSRMFFWLAHAAWSFIGGHFSGEMEIILDSIARLWGKLIMIGITLMVFVKINWTEKKHEIMGHFLSFPKIFILSWCLLHHDIFLNCIKEHYKKN